MREIRSEIIAHILRFTCQASVDVSGIRLIGRGLINERSRYDERDAIISGEKPRRALGRRPTIIDDADRKLIIHCSRPAGANRWAASAK